MKNGQGNDQQENQVVSGSDAILSALSKPYITIHFKFIWAGVFTAHFPLVRANIEAESEDRLLDEELIAQMRCAYPLFPNVCSNRSTKHLPPSHR